MPPNSLVIYEEKQLSILDKKAKGKKGGVWSGLSGLQRHLPAGPEALEAMLPFLHGGHGNPSSIHAAGREARAAVDDSRDQLAGIARVAAP